ncbi:malate:quinone oxidoreductase [Klenkia sp. LSe6-5]|uniref:Probable malate:quinone oxidoreductase n=1 Tax=Klenkia sesuvii TaxID=3103137 RepID=A0ABU8DQ76_9ACTN
MTSPASTEPTAQEPTAPGEYAHPVIPDTSRPDVVLVGGGVMSATLAALLGIVAPHWSVTLFEAGDKVAAESSDGWNNAGTGHSALCELNYTPAGKDGTVDPTKAISINEQFQLSRQFWSHLVRSGLTDSPKNFITPVPHISFVHGEEGQRYMRARHAALTTSPLFAELELTTAQEELARWVPLMMEGRDPAQPVAATRSTAGTDVDFGSLTRLLLDQGTARGVAVHTGTSVQDLERTSDGRWKVTARHHASGQEFTVNAGFVFVGAGGGALPLLQRAGIPEIKGFGGFPVSGLFLRSTNEALAARHQAKVYGQAAVGAPPMSVPHLDLRLIDGQQSLLFGPYAGFSPKFLKSGSWLDLPRSVRLGNLGSMLGVARTQTALTRYLVGQVLQRPSDRLEALEEFVPTADGDDWEMIHAGQRVQVIKQDEKGRGVLQFGTELVVGGEGSIAGLLGASPGASTAVAAMLDLLRRCFPTEHAGWEPRLREAIPSYGRTLADDPALFAEVREETTRTLELTGPVELAGAR